MKADAPARLPTHREGVGAAGRRLRQALRLDGLQDVAAHPFAGGLPRSLPGPGGRGRRPGVEVGEGQGDGRAAGVDRGVGRGAGHRGASGAAQRLGLDRGGAAMSRFQRIGQAKVRCSRCRLSTLHGLFTNGIRPGALWWVCSRCHQETVSGRHREDKGWGGPITGVAVSEALA